MASGAVTRTLSERVRAVEVDLAVKVAEAGPMLDVLASIPAIIHGNRPAAVATLASTLIVSAKIYAKMKVGGPLALGAARKGSGYVKLTATQIMGDMYRRHGTEAERLASFKAWKTVGDACEQVETFNPHKGFLLASKIYGDYRKAHTR